MQAKFNRPIPGESLTSTPRNAPFERPPEITDPEEALEVHLVRLTDEKRMGAAIDLLEVGVDLQSLVEGILRTAVMNGVHSIDVSLVIAPVIHEYIKLTADQLGVDYSEGFDEDEEDEEVKTYAVASAKARKKLKQMDMMPTEEPEETKEEEVEMEEPVAEEKPRGLMVRETM
jgi:hypothetical protein